MIHLSKGGGGGADSENTWIRPWNKLYKHLEDYVSHNMIPN